MRVLLGRRPKPLCGAYLAGAAAAAIAFSASPAMAGCNSGNAANTALLSDGACEANACGHDATAVGRESQATGAGAVAVGALAYAHGANDVSIGLDTGANGTMDGAASVGAYANWNASGLYSTAIGAGDDQDNSGASSTGDYSIAIGGSNGASYHGAEATNTAGIAIGLTSVSSGPGAVSLGGFSQATTSDATAVGYQATASGSY